MQCKYFGNETDIQSNTDSKICKKVFYAAFYMPRYMWHIVQELQAFALGHFRIVQVKTHTKC